MIDTKLLTFLSLCETKSYTKTAELLYITQPSVTNHIKLLEKMYGAKLFEAYSKNFVLTKQGKLLYEYATTLKAMDLEFDNLMASSKVDKVKLRIAAPSIIYKTYLNKILVNVLKKNEAFDIELKELANDEIIEAIEAGKIDIGFTDSPHYKRSFISKQIYKQNIVLLVSKENELANHKKILFDNITTNKILFDQNDLGKIEFLNKELVSKNRNLKELKNKAIVENKELIYEMMEKDLGIYLAYEGECLGLLSEKKVAKIEIIDLKSANDFNVIYSKNHVSIKNIENLIENIEKLTKDLAKNKYNSSFK